ncbi:uncharacterized protein LOC126997880 isoform X2 [Eriocheir sinensis]|nr:uncharacterized protein LOC126997880 isoform X2 [Eriocheir sinensis]XP_050715050.1 uncharacterized protein LOC126997880 isoform X2 [Eriocheir sinensis]XP_050715051.1 uncharacterized protein LOC126997880 isoform X2 [Eriocheir sinensis]XP_050715052.1 uncharacterized protein LOC126997880 isoform X2 [Eriocheir sinensis]XP_050715053.1 uncharacterized protein LOC126997880 isoform X2 [Eriocheir sinensis]
MQRPHTMPCGHTVCTLCIDKLKEQGHVTCPECRVSHAVPKGGHFPVCYTLEAVLRMMRNIKVAAAAASLPPSAEEGKGAAGVAVKKETMDLSKKMRSFLEEQEATVMATITACQKAQSQLDEYQKSLTNWGERQQQLEDRLQGLMDQSKSARELVQQEGSRAAAMGEEVKRGEQGLHNVLETLRTPATDQEAGVAVAEVFRCIGEAEQMVEECQQCFPDASTITVVRKVREASSAAAQAIQAALETHHIVIKEEVHPQSDPEEPRPQADLDFTILDRVQLIMMLSWKQAEDLRSLTQPNRTLLQDGLVFAVHQVEDQRRHAKISFEDGRLYLHALREHPQPLGMATLQMSEFVPPSPPCTVFLDLSWPGSAPRQVQIHLSQDTPWGRQLVMLCTGQHGPSYINTLSAKVRNKGQTGEWMSFGDGFGASDLLPELDVGKYKTSGKAGAVFWLVDEEHWNACGQFGIFTRDCQCKCESTRVFGEVVDGLHVVAEAAQHSNIKEVTVVDCGIVLRD